MNQTSRYDSVDLIKGVGIILVVIGHCHLHILSVDKWIYAFHMPLFAYIGGFFFRMESLKDFTIKKAKRILIPFYVWSLLFWLLYTVIILLFYPSSINSQLHKLLYIVGGSGQNATDNYANVAMWFLPFIFTISLLHFFIAKYINNIKVEYIVIVLMALIGYGLGMIGQALPYSIDTAFTLYPFFWFGTRYIMSVRPKIASLSYGTKMLALVIFLLLYSIATFYNSAVDTASNEIGNPFLFYISALSAILFVSLFSELVTRISWINYLGKNSLIVLIFHIPLITLFNWILSGYDLPLTKFIVLFASIAGCVPIIYLTKKYIPALIGER